MVRNLECTQQRADANSCVNNHTPFTDPNGFTSTERRSLEKQSSVLRVAWWSRPDSTSHDGKNKTFFFTLWQQTISNTRQVVYTNVLTDTARQGIYRYFPGFAPMGYNVNTAIPNQTLPVATATASWVAVDYLGNPVAPPGNPNGTPYTSKLTCFSVFGNQKLDENGNMVPFTAADCPNGTAVIPSRRPRQVVSGILSSVGDSTGYIKGFLPRCRTPTFRRTDGLNLRNMRFAAPGRQHQFRQRTTDYGSQRKQQANQYQDRSQLQPEAQSRFQLYVSEGRQRWQRFRLGRWTIGLGTPETSCLYGQCDFNAVGADRQ